MNVRRVIAGELRGGSSGIASDSLAEKTHNFHSIPGLSDSLVWVLSSSANVDHFQDQTTTLGYSIPRPGEVFARMVQIPPDSVFASRQFDPIEAQAEMALAMPDVEMQSGAEAGMHQTPTFDIVIVESGALHLVMENGDTAELRQADVVVQLGGMHRWSNVTDEPARIFVVSIPRPARL